MCRKYVFYVAFLPGILVNFLPNTTGQVALPIHNCTLNGTSDNIWRKSGYPDPQIDISLCGRACKPSWICDPGHIISKQEADNLDVTIDQIASSGKCNCKSCTDTDGYNISVALVPSSQISGHNYGTLNAKALRLEWNHQKCDNDIVILISIENYTISTEVGITAQHILTAECIGEVHDKVKSSLSDGKYYQVLQEMLKQYKIILSQGNCDYISKDRQLTVASIITGSVYGFAVISITLLTFVRLRTGPQRSRMLSGSASQNEICQARHYHTNNSYEGDEEDNGTNLNLNDGGDETPNS